MGERGSMTAAEFVEKWRGRNLSERQAAHAHFIELCRLLDVPAPLDHAGDDHEYMFDALTTSAGSKVYAAAKGKRGRKADGTTAPPKAASDKGPPTPHPLPLGGGVDAALFPPASRVVSVSAAGKNGYGFADVWKKGHFCWEYKRQGTHPDLAAALRQLKEYKDSLDNPPLLVVCDIDHFEVHTNFTGHPTRVHAFGLEDLAEVPAEWRERGISPLQLLRYVFTQPEWFRPKETVNDITEELAARVGDVAREVGGRKAKDGKPLHDPHDVAHFLMQVVFALFAENVGLLHKGSVYKIVRAGVDDPDRFTTMMRDLFGAMAVGGTFGSDAIDHFNGGLFRNIEAQRVPRLTKGEIGLLSIVAERDWSAIEPSILGTLFERSLDPDKRAQIGAHYTSRADIMLIIGPVVMEPLRREWAEVQSQIANGKGQRANGGRKGSTEVSRHTSMARAEAKAGSKGPPTPHPLPLGGGAEPEALLEGFHARLAAVKVLDPACGSGNFLYVAIQELLTLEKEVIAFGARPEIGVKLTPRVSPTQLLGIEINPYAAELAKVSIWVGYLKWQRENGVIDARRPILDSLETIEERDAILDRSDPKRPVPAKWPEADFIVGNPPFLGSKLMRKNGLDDAYIEALHTVYDELPGALDLCCYWFEQARRVIEKRGRVRTGLLATQGIRGGENRSVLKRIKETGDIFMAWSDREWILDGAAVHVSMVGFAKGRERSPVLDGHPVAKVNADLTSDVATGDAKVLTETTAISFMGITPSGKFDVDFLDVAKWAQEPNPTRCSNLDVLRPWLNAEELVQRPGGRWVIDFGIAVDEKAAAMYQRPFEHVVKHVAPARKGYRTGKRGYWVFERPRPEMRSQLAGLPRFLGTPLVSKHRVYAWQAAGTLPANLVIAFARSDDYFFGVLHSCVHELWALRQGTQLEDRPRYTPTSCFETFPLPWAPGKEPTGKGQRHHGLWAEIGAAAKELDGLREAWLNPAEWIGAVERLVAIKYKHELEAVPADVRPLVRRSAVMAEAAVDKRLKVRTLTNLYNERPACLRLAHKRLDEAVIAAYAAVDAEGGWKTEWAEVYEAFGAGEITDAKGSARTMAKGKMPRGKRDDETVLSAKAAAREARGPVDERVLGNLLRMNGERAGK